MTQLIIDGQEVVLPQNFSTTVKRENPFFTKSGEYTYDVTLSLDNDVNQRLYGFLHRVNKKDQLKSDRKAVLMADGHVYCRGTEIITRWTEQSVTIQIVSGESELNYFMSQDKKVEELEMGKVTNDSWTEIRRKINYHVADKEQGEDAQKCDWCAPFVILPGGTVANWIRANQDDETLCPQPYVVPLMKKLFLAMGYEDADLKELKKDGFEYLILVNTRHTTEYGKMLQGWKVLDLITAIEHLTGVIFIVDSASNTVRAVRKADFFNDAPKRTLRNVTDAYETEVADSDSQDDADWATSNVEYDMPDNGQTRLMQLPEGVKEESSTRDYDSLDSIITAIKAFPSYDAAKEARIIYHDTSTDRYYIAARRDSYDVKIIENAGDVYPKWTFDIVKVHGEPVPLEVDMFRQLHRSDSLPTIQVEITPAPMYFWGSPYGCELIDMRNSESTEQSEEETTPADFEEFIDGYTNRETTAAHLYAAFFSGVYDLGGVAYTDSEHVRKLFKLYNYEIIDSPTESGDRYFEGSLRLKDIDNAVYEQQYAIDTSKAITFETYDPNVADTRDVFIISNKAFVIRDIEETITAHGRQRRWKVTCYPIDLPEAEIEGWVLEHGVWEDLAPWLDDGKWRDEPSE